MSHASASVQGQWAGSASLPRPEPSPAHRSASPETLACPREAQRGVPAAGRPRALPETALTPPRWGGRPCPAFRFRFPAGDANQPPTQHRAKRLRPQAPTGNGQRRGHRSTRKPLATCLLRTLDPSIRSSPSANPHLQPKAPCGRRMPRWPWLLGRHCGRFCCHVAGSPWNSPGEPGPGGRGPRVASQPS